MKMIVLHLILHDKVTNQDWKGIVNPNPKDDRYYHKEIKPLLKAEVIKVLGRRYGDNFDVTIINSDIYVKARILIYNQTKN